MLLKSRFQQTLLILCANALVFSACSSAADNNPYGLDITADLPLYRQQVMDNPDMELMDLEVVLPDLPRDIRYASKDNFTGKIIYEAPNAYVRKPVAQSLKQVQIDLALHNLSLKIYDAYRPYAATVKFYEVFPDTNFVADPRQGSRHNRGCAVDVTLVERDSGRDIPMPTVFDEFSDKAHPDYSELPREVLENRALLFSVMQKHGFTHYPTEWWHFDFNGWERFPLMDLSFTQLKEYARETEHASK